MQTDSDFKTKETGSGKVSSLSDCYVPESVQKEIDRIKRVATIYVELQALMPNYESEYMDAFVELANRFDAVGA